MCAPRAAWRHTAMHADPAPLRTPYLEPATLNGLRVDWYNTRLFMKDAADATMSDLAVVGAALAWLFLYMLLQYRSLWIATMGRRGWLPLGPTPAVLAILGSCACVYVWLCVCW